MCLCIHNTAVKATVVHVVIVGMHRWSWVLLLLLMVRVSIENITCVVNRAT